MKKHLLYILAACLILLSGCSVDSNAQIVATTRPVYEFTMRLCEGADLTVAQLITENVSCLHDYTLQVGQMKALEKAQLVIINGAGFEDFLNDAIPADRKMIDCSVGIDLLHPDATHTHEQEHEHDHEGDPHIWLDISNAQKMIENICSGLSNAYPQFAEVFAENAQALLQELDKLKEYAEENLQSLSCRNLLTFHDGFSYMANSFDLHILSAIEEESGSEASAKELISMISLVSHNHLPAIFTEVNGAVSAATIIEAETGAKIYSLDMGMSQRNYFEAMKHNIDTLKEALQ